MSEELFVDSVFWIALISPRDSLHSSALKLAEEYSDTPLVTTQGVLIEVLNFFSWRGPYLRQAAVDLVEQLNEQPNVLVLEQSGLSFEAGLALYKKRLDKSYSATDCVSMHTMRSRDIRAVLSSDLHFEQEGFALALGSA